jgi:hypothetical protein
MRLGTIGIEVKRLSMAAEGQFQLALACPAVAQVGVRFGSVRVESECVLKRGNRIDDSLLRWIAWTGWSCRANARPKL